MIKKSKLFSEKGVTLIPDISQKLSWLEAHPNALKTIKRGIERETLRITSDGRLATTKHPLSLGAALTHTWITTDFAESLLEFVTPIDQDVDHLLAFLRDIHRYAARKLGKERMWPFSMPCAIENSKKDILLAQYGSSNIGRMKTLYRKGLKNRYGALMQTISGVHYNFSFPISFWKAWAGIKDETSGKDVISSGYLRLIRNYYRFGWIISYLFGASPAVSSSFMQGKKSSLPLKQNEHNMLWLPYATSLRLSDIGYNNELQSGLDITFNTLSEYVNALRNAIKTPSIEYVRMGMKDDNGNWMQLNTNILQIENELYAPIRPKRVIRSGEVLSDILEHSGIEYIEVRSLDINPFSPIGIDATQVRFLDLFLIWCALADAPEMSNSELQCVRKNWNCVILEGRKPNQVVTIGCEGVQKSLMEVGKALFFDLNCVAEILDYQSGNVKYQQVCDCLVSYFDDPTLTCSARILQEMLENGISKTGLALSEKYHKELVEEPLEILTPEDFFQEAMRSRIAQREIEIADTISFDGFLMEES